MRKLHVNSEVGLSKKIRFVYSSGIGFIATKISNVPSIPTYHITRKTIFF